MYGMCIFTPVNILEVCIQNCYCCCLIITIYMYMYTYSYTPCNTLQYIKDTESKKERKKERKEGIIWIKPYMNI